METYIEFYPSDTLVEEFRDIYQGRLLDRLQHWLYRSLLNSEEAREELVSRTHEALLARFWPWSGNIASPVMGYPEGDDVIVPWVSEEEEKMLIALNWSLSGLWHGNQTEGRKGMARKLLTELVAALKTGGVLRSDGAEFSFVDGQLQAHVTKEHQAEFTQKDVITDEEG